MDFSRVRFSSSLQTRPVGELLQAIPLVKGAPIISEYTGSEGITNKISVQIQYLNADDVPEEAPLYDTGTNAPPSVATGLGATEIFYLARLGVYVPATKIDSFAVAREATGNPASNRIATAVHQVLAGLNLLLGSGTGGAQPTVSSFRGIVQLATDLGRTEAASAGLEVSAQYVLSRINPRSRGAGAGPHCLIGNDKMMRSLMATSSGTNGTSGWRHDPRSGLVVYHYQGIPFYRADIPDQINPMPPPPTDTTQGYLFAANLGSDGLHLVHAYGSAESLGVQIDEESTAAEKAQGRYVVHGAWTLITFDPGAIFGVTNLSY